MRSPRPKVYLAMLRELMRHSLALALITACSTSTTTQAGTRGEGGNGGEGDQGRAGGVSTSGGATSASGGGPGAGGSALGGASAGTSGSSSTGGSTAFDLSCSAYCASIQANCATDAVIQYKSEVSCMKSCAAFRLGSIGDTSGNTLGCRARAAMAAAADPAANCAAAGPSGGGRCGTNCEGYCALMATICPSVYEDESICRTACLKMTGVAQTTYQMGGSGDNFQCRLYHVTFAAEGFTEIHCPHAAPVPVAPCAN